MQCAQVDISRQRVAGALRQKRAGRHSPARYDGVRRRVRTVWTASARKSHIRNGSMLPSLNPDPLRALVARSCARSCDRAIFYCARKRVAAVRPASVSPYCRMLGVSVFITFRKFMRELTKSTAWPDRVLLTCARTASPPGFQWDYCRSSVRREAVCRQRQLLLARAHRY